jgi:hypothetical protein
LHSTAIAADWIDDMPDVARVAQTAQEEVLPARRTQDAVATHLATLLILLRHAADYRRSAGP